MVYWQDVAVVVAILLGGCALGLSYLKEPEQGIQGLPPAHEWNMTSIRFMNPNGTWGNYTNIKGATGGQGGQGVQGIQGIQGLRGFNGSAEVNHKPTFNVTTLNGYYHIDGNDTVFTFNISVVVHDLDNDTVQSMIYYRTDNVSGQWIQSGVFFMLNNTNSVQVEYVMDSPMNQRMYWAIEGLDGRDITMKYESYLVMYP